jgi:predicted house-cleaning noncanonical NTP pyrophosphatase (MazG superfamily)
VKLVRDKIPELYPQHDYHQAGPASDEYRLLLRLKLAEEVGEVLSAPTRHARVQELADVYEVLDALCRAEGVPATEVSVARLHKNMERGPFDRGWVLE